MTRTDILIIGTGLAGLTLHHFLKDHNTRFCVVEATGNV